MPPLPIGTILDRKFKIVSVLGEGGMGTVYKVEQVDRPGIFRAVKELLINPNTPDEERRTAIERFEKEIDLLYTLKHQRIPSLIVSFQEGGRYYFVMEFVPGKTLEQILETSQAPLDEDRVIHWMIQVCEALTYIHTRTPPIVLRDLKPGNIMVSSDNEVNLIDFGIARRFKAGKQTNTENLGTVSYASPEHLGSIIVPGQNYAAQNPVKQKVQTDARSDLYSLGATMYHLLTNHEPDPIKTPAQGSILAKNPRLRTVQINGKTICPVEQVIIKAMQLNPAQRFQTAEAMRSALQHCLPNQGQGASTTIQIPALSPNMTIVVPAAVAAGVVCPKCGYLNRPGAKFCKRDGASLTPGARAAPPQIRGSNAARPAAPPPPIRARPSQPAASVASPVLQSAARPAATSSANGPAPASRGDPQATYALGLQFLNTKYYAEAISQFKLAQAGGMASYDLEFNLGRAYRQYGQTFKEKDRNQFTEQMKLAAELFEQAIATRSDAVDAYFQLGMTYNDLGLYDKASTIFSRALQYAPNDSALYLQLGLVAENRGYSREAEGYYQEGLRINPDNVTIQLALGRLYLITKQVKRAIVFFQRVTQRNPGMWETWFELGHAHMKAREWRQALSALEQARQWNTNAPEIYNAMAECYLRTNKRAEAREMLRESLQRDPNNHEATRLQKQL